MNLLADKIENLVQWISLAFEYYHSGRYGDSLTNMRKSGEAICKIILYNRYSEKSADAKIENKTYKELIELLISEALITRQVVNWLEVFQIYGNIATHDNTSLKEHADYGINALRLAVRWVFEEHLKILIPSRISRHLTPVAGTGSPKNIPVNEEFLKVIQKEKESFLTQKELLQQQLKSSEDIQSHLTQKNRQLESGFQKLQLSVREKNNEIDILKNDLSRISSNADSIKEQAQYEIRKKIRRIWKFIIPVLLIFLFALAGILKGVFYFNGKNMNVQTSIKDTAFFRVLILPFYVMQDNPGITINIESAFQYYFESKKENRKVQFEIIREETQPRSVYTRNQAIDLGLKRGADMVIYGALFERGGNDTVHIVCHALDVQKPEREFSAEKDVVRLNDMESEELFRNFDCFTVLLLALKNMNVNRYDKALLFLEEIAPTDKILRGIYYELKSQGFLWIGDNKNALAFIDSSLNMYPDVPFKLKLKALALMRLENYSEAEKCYRKGLSIDPSYTDMLADYLFLLLTWDPPRYEESYTMAIQILHKDTANAMGWLALAEFVRHKKEYVKAKEYYYKSLAANNNNLFVKKKLTTLLISDLPALKEALSQMKEAYVLDSNDFELHYFLGIIYGSAEINNPTLSEYHLKKSMEIEKTPYAGALFNLGLAAYNKNDFINAKEYFLKAYRMDTASAFYTSYVGRINFELGLFEEAKKYFELVYRMDSASSSVNTWLGLFYYDNRNTKYYSINKAIDCFYRSFLVNPYDTLVLMKLGEAYYRTGNIPNGNLCFENLLKVDPHNFNAHYLLGKRNHLDREYIKAENHYLKAISINPGRVEIYVEMADIYSQKPLFNRQLALQYADEVCKRNPDNGDDHFRIAIVYLTFNNMTEAKKHYARAIELNPALKFDVYDKLLQ